MYFRINIVSFCVLLCAPNGFCVIEEGGECITEDGLKGVCRHIYQCLAVVKDLRDKIYPKICSFQGEDPIVCCTDCEDNLFKVNDTRNVVLNQNGDYFLKTGRVAEDKCLEYLLTLPYPCPTFGGLKKGLHPLHPVNKCHGYFHGAQATAGGGVDAKRDEFPHMALLGFGDDLETAQWLCGGSVISDKFILTAAHCNYSRSIGFLRFVALGILRRTDPPELWQRYNVLRFIPHPEYQPPSKYHDVALIEVEGRITFNKQVLPACLDVTSPSKFSFYLYDDKAFATGWGALGHRAALADTLQTVRLTKYSEVECQAAFPPYRLLKSGYNHTTQMCYGDKEEINDTCEGDSGGPLQVLNTLSHCAYKILGVTSYGRPCGFSGGIGMYTRVKHYVSWIESIVWQQ